MAIDSTRRKKLLQLAKRGRQTGATQWTRLFIMLAGAAEMFNLVLDVHRGRGNFILLTDAIIMVYIVAIAAIGLGVLELNERFTSLIESLN